MISLRNALRRCFLVGATISILGSVYVLSVGPALWLAQKTGRGDETIESIYAPIVWFHENTVLRKPIEIYADFFEGD